MKQRTKRPKKVGASEQYSLILEIIPDPEGKAENSVTYDCRGISSANIGVLHYITSYVEL